MLEGEPFDECDALQDSDVRVQITVDRARGEALSLRRDEREPLPGLRQRIDHRVDRASLEIERIEVRTRQKLGQYAGAAAGRAAGKPAAVGVEVAVDRARRVVEELLADAFEHERRAEHRIPG